MWLFSIPCHCLHGAVLRPDFLCELFSVVLAALWNRAGHYIFALWFLSFFLVFFPRLISAVTEWMSTMMLLHMVWHHLYSTGQPSRWALAHILVFNCFYFNLEMRAGSVVCLFECLWVGLSRCISQKPPNFMKFSVHVACVHGSVVLRQQCNTSCTSSFVVDLVFIFTYCRIIHWDLPGGTGGWSLLFSDCLVCHSSVGIPCCRLSSLVISISLHDKHFHSIIIYGRPM